MAIADQDTMLVASFVQDGIGVAELGPVAIIQSDLVGFDDVPADQVVGLVSDIITREALGCHQISASVG
jgi:hypothetical protein